MLPYILNLIDLALTLYAINNGAAELNPFLQNVPTMILYKTVIVGIICYWLTTRPEKLARYGLRLTAILYGLVVIYHLFYLTHPQLWTLERMCINCPIF